MKRFRRPIRKARPAYTWYDVSAAWVHAAITATATTNLINLQTPAATINVSSDPVEDLVIDRIQGWFNVGMSVPDAVWILGLTVQDTTWAQAASFALDSDKRWLWYMVYDSSGWTSGGLAGAGLTTWSPSGYVTVVITADNIAAQCDTRAVSIDISPRVKITPGQSLNLAAYEVSGTSNFSTSSQAMRLLFHRAGRG